MKTKTGIELIADERQRQVTEEYWTAAHDDTHDDNELAKAGAAYALKGHNDTAVPSCWPWDDEWWKPTPDNRIGELQKAGVLIAAEIDRLQRII